MDTPKITTFSMFNNQAEEAVKLYTSLSEDSETITMAKYGENGPGDPGTIQHSILILNGQVFMATDASSGIELSMNPTVSSFVTVKGTIEMERLSNGLKDEGVTLIPKTNMPPYREFAWVQDRFRVSFRLASPE